jgi:hypothetical protein
MPDGIGGFGGPAGHAPLMHGPHPKGQEAPEKDQAEDHADSLDLQQRAGNSAVAGMLGPSRGDRIRSLIEGPGTSMDPTVVETVREATGDDASGIVVHDGPEATEAAESVQANMFASGNHIVAPKGLDVTSKEGLFKTVHEVHHIVNQQAKGPVEGTDTDDGLKISDPADRHEQEADAAAALAVETKFGPGSQ